MIFACIDGSAAILEVEEFEHYGDTIFHVEGDQSGSCTNPMVMGECREIEYFTEAVVRLSCYVVVFCSSAPLV